MTEGTYSLLLLRIVVLQLARVLMKKKIENEKWGKNWERGKEREKEEERGRRREGGGGRESLRAFLCV